jgi:hypothetical protein
MAGEMRYKKRVPGKSRVLQCAGNPGRLRCGFAGRRLALA